MTTEQFEKLKTLLFYVVKPSITEMFHHYNPVHFNEWQRNCCRQTAFLTALLIDEIILFPGNQSGYKETRIFHGEFEDQQKGRYVEYNHAWLHLIHATDPKKNIIIDIGRNHKTLLFQYFEPVGKYPQIHELDDTWKHMRTLKRWEESKEEMIYGNEYFTQKPTDELYGRLKKYLQIQHVFLNKTTN
jgi:hypothetical protein